MLEIITIKDIKVKIGKSCVLHRKLNSLSREQLAEALGVSSTTIQNIENGKNITLDNILKVANHFGLLGSISISIELDKSMNHLNNTSLY